jgi:hypothetical protein
VNLPPLTGPMQFLRGCPEPPAGVAVSAECDTVAACCPTAGLCMWSLIRGCDTMRRVPAASGTVVTLTTDGYAVVYDPVARRLACACCGTGELVASCALPPDEGHVMCMLTSCDGKTLVTGTTCGGHTGGTTGASAARVGFFTLPGLQPRFRFALPDGSGVSALSLLEGDTLLAVATTIGALLVICDPRAPPPKPMLDRLKEATQYD